MMSGTIMCSSKITTMFDSPPYKHTKHINTYFFAFVHKDRRLLEPKTELQSWKS